MKEETMIKVELIYDVGCPNIPQARELLETAKSRLSLDLEWIEWDRASNSSPSYALQYGSPTILVDGKDIVPQPTSCGNSCRIYRDSSGVMIKAPPLENLIKALEAATSYKIPQI